MKRFMFEQPCVRTNVKQRHFSWNKTEFNAILQSLHVEMWYSFSSTAPLVSSFPRRVFRFLIYRMLLLKSLQSKLLLCKLLEQLLDYACPQKTSVPMSLSLLLHFMKNCTLAPDQTVNSELPSFNLKKETRVFCKLGFNDNQLSQHDITPYW